MKRMEGYQAPVKLDFNWNVTEECYRADPRLNFHKLADFKRDPRAFHDGLFDVREETDAMRFGTALHALILQGESVFANKAASFNPPINPKTGEPYGATTNAFKEARSAFESANVGKTIISNSDRVLIEKLRDEFFFHPYAPSCLGSADWAASEIPVCGEINLGSGETFPVKGLIDRYSEAGLIDVKTTACLDDGSGRDKFRYAMYDYKYIVQIAFYHMILTDCYNAPFVPCYIVAFEKNAPNRVAVYAIAPEVITKAREVVRCWIRDFQESVNTKTFESRFDKLQIVTTYDAERDL